MTGADDNTTSGTAPHAGHGPVDRLVRPGSEARWYCLSRDGMATLCADEEDANETAAESFVLYPQHGPYRVAQMVDKPPPLTRRELELLQLLIERELWHAKTCDAILSNPDGNHQMASAQKGWDMERVALLRKLCGLVA